MHGIPYKSRAPCTNLVSIVLLPIENKFQKSVVSFKYEQHSLFPRSFYIPQDWPDISIAKFDGKYTTFFNQGNVFFSNIIVQPSEIKMQGINF